MMAVTNFRAIKLVFIYKQPFFSGRLLYYYYLLCFYFKIVAAIMQIKLQVGEPVTGRIESREIVYNFLFNLRKLRLPVQIIFFICMKILTENIVNVKLL